MNATAFATAGAGRASSSRPPVFGGGSARSTTTAAASMPSGNPFSSGTPAAWRGNASATQFGNGGGFGNPFAQPSTQASAGVPEFGTFGAPTGSFGTSLFGKQDQFPASSPFGVSSTSSLGFAQNANARIADTGFRAGGNSGFSSRGAPAAAGGAKQSTTGWFPLGDGINSTPKPAQQSAFGAPFQTTPVNPFLGSKGGSSVVGPQPFNSVCATGSSSRLSSNPRSSLFAPRAPAAADSNPFATGNSGASSVQKNAFSGNWFGDKLSQTNQTVGTERSSLSPFGGHLFRSEVVSVSPATSPWQVTGVAPLRATSSVNASNSATAQRNTACAPFTGAISENAGFRFTFTPSWQPNAELPAQRATPAQQQKIFSSCFSFPKKSVFDFNFSGHGTKQGGADTTPLFAFKSGSDWNTINNSGSGSTVATGFDVKLTANASTSTEQDTAKSLVALPDVNPYGAGSFGAGSLEVAVNAALNFGNAHASANNFLSSNPKPNPKPSANHVNLGLPTRPINCSVLKSNRRTVSDCSSLRVASIRRVVGGVRGVKAGQAASVASCGKQRASVAQSEFSFKSSLFRELGPKKQLEQASEPLCETTLDVEAGVQGDDNSEEEQNQNVHLESTLTDSEEEEEEQSPPVNPACPILTNPHISTVPELSQLQRMLSEDLAQVDGFAIRSAEFGEIEWPGVTDVRHLNLDEILEFSESEVVVYPDEYPTKPKVGQGLNKRAILRLSHIYPSEKNRNSSGDDDDAVTAAFVERLKKRTADLRAQFLDYEAAGGVWKFEVQHF